MRKTTADKRRGIRWNLTTELEDLDFADDIALLSSKFNDLHEKTGRLAEEAEGQSIRSQTKLGGRAGKQLRSCTRQKVYVRQRGGLMRLRAR